MSDCKQQNALSREAYEKITAIERNNMKTININGVEYVEKTGEYKESEHVCVICDRGWIFEGRKVQDSPMRLTDANVVRKWDNGRGIGGIARAEYKDEYTLDPVGLIELHEHAVLAVIPLEW